MVCSKVFEALWKSGPAKTGPAGPVPPPLQDQQVDPELVALSKEAITEEQAQDNPVCYFKRVEYIYVYINMYIYICIYIYIYYIYIYIYVYVFIIYIIYIYIYIYICIYIYIIYIYNIYIYNIYI